MKTTTVYKLTDKNSQTRNNTQWGPNVTHKTDGLGEMCGSGWLHAYHHPLLAVLLNPAHGNFDSNTMKLWKCRGFVGIRQADKLGCTILTTEEEIEIPKVTTTQRCAFAILVAQEVYEEKSFQVWAKNWLSSKNRSHNASYAAAKAADAATYATYAAASAASAAYAATNAADAAKAVTSAAYAAAKAADAAASATYASYAANAAAVAETAAANATYAAANAAANAAAYAAKKLTDKRLFKLAEKAIKDY